MDKTLIAVVGPTAIGKTSLAIALAKQFETEIISADSRQFYKEMCIGTAVPSKAELAKAKHHFIQHISVKDPWSVGDFEKAAIQLLDDLFKEKDIVIAVGGSGLYIRALAEGLDHFPEVDPAIREELNKEFTARGIDYLQSRLKELDPEYYKQVDLQNPHRIIRALEVSIGSRQAYSSYLNKPKALRSFRTIYLGLTAERGILYQRIEARVDQMMRNGLLEEARTLRSYKQLGPLQTVGYKEIFEYFDAEMELDEAVLEIKKNTRRFAKRQLTWFRKNQDIHWFDFDTPLADIIQNVKSLLKSDHHAGK